MEVRRMALYLGSRVSSVGAMRPLILESGRVGTMAFAFLFATAAFWLVGESRQSSKQRGEATEADAGSGKLLGRLWRAGLVIGILAATALPSATIAYKREGVFLAGMGLIWAGIGLRFWAFRTLGEYFTFTVMTSPDQKVVTHGPYGFVRHPSYTGATVALAGFGLAMGNFVSLAALVLLPLIGVVNRIRVEEAALLAALGPQYESFAARRKRLVPFVW